MKKNILFTMVTITLLFIAVCSIGMTVKSMDKCDTADQHYYDVLESEYMDEVKEILEQYHLYNSGITMTRTTDIEGERSYVIQIHNSKLCKMDDFTQEELAEKIKEVKFHEVEVAIRQELIADIN